MKKRESNADVELAICRFYAAGESMVKIGSRYGVSEHTIKAVLRDYKVEIRKPGARAGRK